MYIEDGIAYAGELVKPIKVVGVRALDEKKLWLRFSTGEEKLFDFSPLLTSPAFKPLNDEKVFKDVYLDFGCPVWLDGDIDISPEFLYENSTAFIR